MNDRFDFLKGNHDRPPMAVMIRSRFSDGRVGSLRTAVPCCNDPDKGERETLRARLRAKMERLEKEAEQHDPR